MKKVVIISPRFGNAFSGGEIYIAGLAEHLATKYEVHIFSPVGYGEYPDIENVFLHYLEGIGTGKINLNVGLSNLREELLKVNPDFVHLHCFMSMLLYTSIIESDRYKLMITVHSTPDGKTKLFSWIKGIENQKALLKNMFMKNKVYGTFFGSNYYLKEYLKEVPEIGIYSSTYVNSYFSNIKSISILKRMEIDKVRDKIHILFPSRIEQRKGIMETLDLLKLLPDNYVLDLPAMPQKEYMNYNSVVLDRIKELNLEDRVFFPKEIVIGRAMYDYYKKADITIIPSYFEGFGIVAVEALNCSSPVITTCSGGLNEIISDGYNGVKMTLDNLEKAKNDIIRMIEDSKFRYMLIENGKKTVKEKFTKKRHMDLIDKVYEEAINEK